MKTLSANLLVVQHAFRAYLWGKKKENPYFPGDLYSSIISQIEGMVGSLTALSSQKGVDDRSMDNYLIPTLDYAITVTTVEATFDPTSSDMKLMCAIVLEDIDRTLEFSSKEEREVLVYIQSSFSHYLELFDQEEN